MRLLCASPGSNCEVVNIRVTNHRKETKPMTGNNRGHAVKLSSETKKRLVCVRDLLEEAIQEQFSEGLAPGVRSPRISQSYTIGAALEMLRAS